MSPATKIINELKAREWQSRDAGLFTELRKGPVFAVISDAAVSCTVEPVRPGINLWPMNRITKERLFIVQTDEEAKSLTPEEQELRTVVLEQTA